MDWTDLQSITVQGTDVLGNLCLCAQWVCVCVCFWGRGDMIVGREAGHVLVSGASRELFVTEMCVCVYTCGRCA